MFVRAAAEINAIVAERDSSNQAGDALPPVVPKHLVKIDMRALVGVMNKHMDQLSYFYSDEAIECISTDFAELKQLYREDSQLKQAIDDCSDVSTSFTEAWALLSDKCGHLREFCGGLASAFPNTASVESDFSVINWEKDDNRTSLTDFSLEGVVCGEVNLVNPSPSIGMNSIPISQRYEKDEEEKVSSEPLAYRYDFRRCAIHWLNRERENQIGMCISVDRKLMCV